MEIIDDILGAEDHLVASCEGFRWIDKILSFWTCFIAPEPVYVDVNMHSLSNVHLCKLQEWIRNYDHWIRWECV